MYSISKLMCQVYTIFPCGDGITFSEEKIRETLMQT